MTTMIRRTSDPVLALLEQPEGGPRGLGAHPVSTTAGGTHAA